MTKPNLNYALKALAAILSFFSFFLSVAAQEKSDREKSELKGFVKSVREETASIVLKNGSPVEKDRELDWIETFDLSGGQVSYSFGEREETKQTLIYDAKGRVAEIRQTKTKNSYLIPRKVRKYDEADRIVAEEGLDDGGSLLGKRTYRYDPQGNLVEEISQGQKPYYNDYLTKYKYDQKNRLLEKATYKEIAGGLTPEDFRLGYYKQTYLYNADGDRIGEIRIGPDEKLYQTTMSLKNKKGELEVADYFPDGNIKSITKYVEQDFDKQGNYTKQTEYKWITEDGRSFFQATEVTYRKIEYFSEKEIKDFSAGNNGIPDKPQEQQVLQNTEKEEYAVYQAILEPWTKSDFKHIVIDRFTDTSSFGMDLQVGLLDRPNQPPLLDQPMIDDFNEKNNRRSWQLLEELFGPNKKIILVDESETSKIFSDRDDGWTNFYKKYPDSQGLTTFSRVGFNKGRTKAVLYFGTQSDWLAGAGYFVILQKESDNWKIVNQLMIWIS